MPRMNPPKPQGTYEFVALEGESALRIRDDAAESLQSAGVDLDLASAMEQEAAPEPIGDSSYVTATTEVARDIIAQRRHLAGLIAEDEDELQFHEEHHREVIRRINARMQDRIKAHAAYGGLIDALGQR